MKHDWQERAWSKFGGVKEGWWSFECRNCGAHSGTFKRSTHPDELFDPEGCGDVIAKAVLES